MSIRHLGPRIIQFPAKLLVNSSWKPFACQLTVLHLHHRTLICRLRPNTISEKWKSREFWSIVSKFDTRMNEIQIYRSTPTLACQTPALPPKWHCVMVTWKWVWLRVVHRGWRACSPVWTHVELTGLSRCWHGSTQSHNHLGHVAHPGSHGISSVYTAVHGSTWVYICLNWFTSVYIGAHWCTPGKVQ